MSATVAVLAAAAAALPPMLPDTYTLLCQAEQSTGFNWANGDWVKRNYKPPSLIVQVGKPNVCFGDKIDKVTDLGTIRMRKVCGNIREVGGRYVGFMSMECNEMYSSGPDGGVRTLRCHSADETFAAAVDGLFQHSTIHGDVSPRPKNDYKDSLAIDVGKCSTIK